MKFKHCHNPLFTGGYALLVGGVYEIMETWSRFNAPQYNPLPPSNLYGSSAARLGSALYSCGGEGAMKDCYRAHEGQANWIPVPSLQVSSHITEVIFQAIQRYPT